MLQLSPIKVSVFMSLFLCAGVAVFVAIHFMRLDKAIDLNDQMVILSLNVLQKHFFCCHANGKHSQAHHICIKKNNNQTCFKQNPQF